MTQEQFYNEGLKVLKHYNITRLIQTPFLSLHCERHPIPSDLATALRFIHFHWVCIHLSVYKLGQCCGSQQTDHQGHQGGKLV